MQLVKGGRLGWSNENCLSSFVPFVFNKNKKCFVSCICPGGSPPIFWEPFQPSRWATVRWNSQWVIIRAAVLHKWSVHARSIMIFLESLDKLKATLTVCLQCFALLTHLKNGSQHHLQLNSCICSLYGSYLFPSVHWLSGNVSYIWECPGTV